MINNKANRNMERNKERHIVYYECKIFLTANKCTERVRPLIGTSAFYLTVMVLVIMIVMIMVVAIMVTTRIHIHEHGQHGYITY